MRYIRHHAIVVTTWDDKKIEVLRNNAIKIFGNLVTEVIKSNINGYNTFFIAPDGSKEGWEDSDIGDKNRSLFLSYIKGECDYAELFYGDDEGESKIINHS